MMDRQECGSLLQIVSLSCLCFGQGQGIWPALATLSIVLWVIINSSDGWHFADVKQSHSPGLQRDSTSISIILKINSNINAARVGSLGLVRTLISLLSQKNVQRAQALIHLLVCHSSTSSLSFHWKKSFKHRMVLVGRDLLKAIWSNLLTKIRDILNLVGLVRAPSNVLNTFRDGAFATSGQTVPVCHHPNFKRLVTYM